MQMYVMTTPAEQTTEVKPIGQAGQAPRGVNVSYKHLRAHENVLDLVCRLLFEKKKNNKILEAQTQDKEKKTYTTE